MIGVSWDTVMSQNNLDQYILLRASVSLKWWRVQDYSSDIIILNISSVEAPDNINLVKNISYVSICF